jgi:hypothetical protein
MRRPQRATAGRDRGAVTIWLVIFAAALVALAGMVSDAGTALAARTRAYRTAAQAARAGADAMDVASLRTATPGQPITINPAAAIAAAQGSLRAAGVTGQVAVTGAQVTVTTTITSHNLFLGAVGLGSLTVTGRATATNIQGITSEER